MTCRNYEKSITLLLLQLNYMHRNRFFFICISFIINFIWISFIDIYSNEIFLPLQWCFIVVLDWTIFLYMLWIWCTIRDTIYDTSAYKLHDIGQ